MDRKQIHKAVLEAKTTDELMEAYKKWADCYDTDLLSKMGYKAPAITTAIFTNSLDTSDPKILDVGCGTGIVGSLLAQSGYTSIDGLDYSQDMLQKATQKKDYQTLIQADLTKPLDMESDQYDAIISVGTFTLGHVGPEAFAELIRITKPGGTICVTVRQEAWDKHDYRKHTLELELENKWKLQEMQTVEYIQEEGSQCKVLVYEVV